MTQHLELARPVVKVYPEKPMPTRDSPHDVRERILDTADQMIRIRGFNGFSFRDIAAAVGVKSASVHYHFPTKGALGAEVTRRYTDRFLEGLAQHLKPNASAEKVVETLGAQTRQALSDGRMCLCGMLGAEVASLPAEVQTEVRRFYERNLEWLVSALRQTTWGQGRNKSTLRKLALRALSTVEGAMLLAHALGDLSVFDNVEFGKLV